MLTKCICTNCAGHLEFEEENAGEKITCPHCGFETTLFLPGTQPPDPEMSALLRRLGRRRRLIWCGAGVLVCAGVGYALWRWGLPVVQDWLPNTDSKVALWAVMIVGCLVVPLALFWLLFPLLLCLQLRRLTHVLSDLSEAIIASPAEPAATEPEILDDANDEEPVTPRAESIEGKG